MALSVSIGSDGRISKGTNVIVPKENAGIGDLVYGSRGDHIIVARGTGDGSNVSGKSIYGCIYGFVNGEAMIVAPDTETSKTWGSNVSGMPTLGSGNIRMRNGMPTNSYAQMNTKRQMASDSYRGTAGSNVHPTAAYNGGVMTESTFNSSAAAKAIYGTWWNYLRQTLRVNGAPGTIFGMTGGGCKVHEFGRWMAKTYGASSSTGTAMRDCYDYREGGGTWWLPSMFELAELMIDEHLDLVNSNNGSNWTDVNKGSYRWSCCLRDSSYAWLYDDAGMSTYTGLSGSYTARPVSLLTL